SRIANVTDSLRGEKVDIISWDADLATFIMKALAPAKVIPVELFEDDGVALVSVPDYQLSLAIGREGQNVRLAARLTGWRIDIRADTADMGPVAASARPDDGEAGSGPGADAAQAL